MLEKKEKVFHKKIALETEKAREFSKLKNKKGEELGVCFFWDWLCCLSGVIILGVFEAESKLFSIFRFVYERCGFGSCDSVFEAEEDV